MGLTPHLGQNMGLIPHLGQNMGLTPHLGQNMGLTPHLGHKIWALNFHQPAAGQLDPSEESAPASLVRQTHSFPSSRSCGGG